ncbi:MAG: outer membrane protein assembly factor BamD, partial [Planctomycetota bacterium]
DPESNQHVELFREAANQFRLAAGKFPDSQLEHDALFFEGESYFFADDYVQANRALENLISRYSGTRYLDKAEAYRFSIAQYWQQLADAGPSISLTDSSRPVKGLLKESQRIFHRIRLDDPTGKLADDATLALANAYFKAENWNDAANTYEDLRRNYPGSPHQFHAHMFELKSRLNSYEGKSYDATPLNQADKLLKQVVSQFPDQARQEREYLAQEAGTIRHLLAEREWAMAQYFEKQGENQAAQFYYQQVAKNFSDTEFSDRVTGEIERIAELPAKPKQHAQWLVDLFPESEKAKPVIASSPGALLR